MSMSEMEIKIQELRQLQSLIGKATAEAIKDAIKAETGDTEELWVLKASPKIFYLRVHKNYAKRTPKPLAGWGARLGGGKLRFYHHVYCFATVF